MFSLLFFTQVYIYYKIICITVMLISFKNKYGKSAQAFQETPLTSKKKEQIKGILSSEEI